MAKCKFEYNDKTQEWVCTKCGRRVRASKSANVHAECRRGATFIQMAVNYAKAVATHISTGANTRTDDEVNALLEVCQNCEYYNAEGQYCRVCGCRCTNGSNAFFNKLRMDSQHCPRGKW